MMKIKNKNNSREEEEEEDTSTSSSSTRPSSGVIDYIPQRNINIVKKKLNLYNPVNILLEELSYNEGIRDFRNECEKILKDRERLRWREIENDKICSNISHQVECLIDLAIDPNILGRQWVGLNTWC